MHRNVADVLREDDDNAMSVLELALDVLAVPDVIVCGHSHCYGVEAAWRKQGTGRAGKWLARAEEVAADELEARFDAALYARSRKAGELVRPERRGHGLLVDPPPPVGPEPHRLER